MAYWHASATWTVVLKKPGAHEYPSTSRGAIAIVCEIPWDVAAFFASTDLARRVHRTFKESPEFMMGDRRKMEEECTQLQGYNGKRGTIVMVISDTVAVNSDILVIFIMYYCCALVRVYFGI